MHYSGVLIIQIVQVFSSSNDLDYLNFWIFLNIVYVQLFYAVGFGVSMIIWIICIIRNYLWLLINYCNHVVFHKYCNYFNYLDNFMSSIVKSMLCTYNYGLHNFAVEECFLDDDNNNNVPW